MTQPQPELVELYRAGLKGAVDLMKASLENAERLQNQQLTAIRSALDAQSKSASELGAAKSIDELFALQTRLAGAQMERMMGYWTSLYETQMTALEQMQSQFQRTLESARQPEAPTSAALSPARRETKKAR